MEGDLLIHLRLGLELARGQKVREQLGVMDDLVLATKLRVLVLQGVEAVRAARDDALYIGLIERVDVLLGLLLEQELVASAPGRIAGAAFLLTEHRKAGSCRMEHLDECAHRLLDAIVVGRRAADKQQVLEVGPLGHGRHRHFQVFGPLHALVGIDSPGVAVALKVLERAL